MNFFCNGTTVNNTVTILSISTSLQWNDNKYIHLEADKTYHGLVLTIHVPEFCSGTLMPNFDLLVFSKLAHLKTCNNQSPFLTYRFLAIIILLL